MRSKIELKQKVIESLEDFVYRNFYTKGRRNLKLAKYQANIKGCFKEGERQIHSCKCDENWKE